MTWIAIQNILFCIYRFILQEIVSFKLLRTTRMRYVFLKWLYKFPLAFILHFTIEFSLEKNKKYSYITPKDLFSSLYILICIKYNWREKKKYLRGLIVACFKPVKTQVAVKNKSAKLCERCLKENAEGNGKPLHSSSQVKLIEFTTCLIRYCDY